MLELQGLTRRYGDLVALDDLSFTVAEDHGQTSSTTVRSLAGLLGMQSTWASTHRQGASRPRAK
jgi:ABC-type Na+ transport system ATPase subunit NatA